MSLRYIAFMAVLCLAGAAAQAQTPNAEAPAESGPIIKTETRLVLVDTVVTDKKGDYVRDLKAKDFRVWEDNKEQPITSFSFEADPASPSNSRKHYLVLLFDNSTLKFGDQVFARKAAASFIDANAGPNRMIAIANYAGGLQIAQNFTDDSARLKGVVNATKFSPVSSAPSTAGVPLLTVGADFGATNLLLAVRDLAKGLSTIPGRKIVVLLTAGFPLNPELMSDGTVAIDACNKANVAIYPIDVRGLVTTVPHAAIPSPHLYLRQVAFTGTGIPGSMSFFMPQQGTGGGGAPGGGSHGGPAGGRGTAPAGGGSSHGGPTPNPSGNRPGTGRPGNPGGGARPSPTINPYNRYSPFNPYNQSRSLIPKMPDNIVGNQQLMFMLANGTGGFVIHDTNDLLGGLEKIGKEQNEYYLLGYTPPEAKEGSCHVLRVKVDRGGTHVRARSGYCNTKPKDSLAGSPIERQLEVRVAASQPGNMAASMQLPFFYTSPNVARVNVALDIEPAKVKFEKEKGRFQAAINVLGIAYTSAGTVGARFSDTVKLDLQDKKEIEKFKEQPFHYENQFDVASGAYSLKVVFSSGGENFGKLEMPLKVDPYASGDFALSGLALSKEAHAASDFGVGLDASLLEDKTPLIANGARVIPTGTNEFKKAELAVFYFEIYEPLLLNPDPKNPPAVAIQMRVLDRKTGRQIEDSGPMRIAMPAQSGNPVIPIAEKMPVTKLGPGDYILELTAQDTAGKAVRRTADFEME